MTTQNKTLVKAIPRSGGARTTRGKALVKMNAISHGLGCLAPVIPGERKKDWKAHLSGMLATISPVGVLEVELAEQVALITWRMRRVIRYETAALSGKLPSTDGNHAEVGTICYRPVPRTREVILGEIDTARGNSEEYARLQEGYRSLQTAPADQQFDGQEAFALLIHASDCTSRSSNFLAEVRDHHFLLRIGVPVEFRNIPESWKGWTAGVLMKGMSDFGQRYTVNQAVLIERVLDKTKQLMEKELETVKRLEAELLAIPVDAAAAEESMEEFVPVMDQTMLNNVMRYGGFLRRELNDTLDTLDRLQANRKRL